MAIDPRIALQVQQFQAPDMLNALAKAQDVKTQQMRGRMAEREMQAMDAEAQNNANLNAMFKESGGDFDKMMQNPNLDMNTALKLHEISANKAKAGAESKNAEIGLAIKQIEAGTMILGSAQDQGSYDAGLKRMQQMGMDTSQFPTQFSPEVRDQIIQSGMSVKDRLLMQRDDKKNALEERRIGLLEQKIAQGGQSSGVDAQDKGWEVKETANGLVRVNKYTGDVAPVTMEGQTLKGKQSSAVATEDERKAAGWASQMELAKSQISNILKSDPSASDKGVMESLAPGELLSRQAMSENRKRYVDAISSLSEAALRAATGAGINESEAKQKISELSPVFGDSEAIIADKMARMDMYIQSVTGRAGRAQDMIVKPDAPQQPTLSGQDAQALQWAQQNPNDPRAQAIMRRLSGNGI